MTPNTNDIFMGEFSLHSIVEKMDKIKVEMEKCSKEETEDAAKRRDELMWAQFMAGLRLSSGNIYF